MSDGRVEGGQWAQCPQDMGAWSVAAVCAVCTLLINMIPSARLGLISTSISLKRRSGEQTSGHSFGPES